MEEAVERAADLISAAGPVVAFTGAGVSTESGIPDFRSQTGLWARYDPEDFSFTRFVGSEEGRRRYWAVGRELYSAIRRAEPNDAHRALVRLDALGLLDCVITQNVDDLHQRAGTPSGKLVELHGNATRARCLGCGVSCPRDAIQQRLLAGEEVPACLECGGILKPHTVLFGEAMPEREVRLAQERSRSAGCFVVVGSSLTVYPAGYMPIYAKESGAHLIIVNLTPTRLDHAADVVLRGQAGPILSRLVGETVRRVAGRPADARR